MKHCFKITFLFFTLFVFFTDIRLSAQQHPDFELYELWTGGDIPASADLSELDGVEFHSIKKFEPEHDGYRFLHGVAIARFDNQWVATFGHIKGPENTGSEEAQSLFSSDGKTWGQLVSIENPPGDWGASHGVLLNYRDTLWSFNAYFQGIMKDLRTTAYTWDNDGDFTRWQVKHVPMPAGITVWGESTVMVDGPTVILISRSSNATPQFEGHSHPLAWVAVSEDFGHTWTELQPSNMPMAASKPYAGVLSTGHRYLVATTTADTRNARSPLTIAVSKPGENTFHKIYCIRRGIHRQGDVESDPNAGLAYPYAIEYGGHLYVVYSNTGGRGGDARSEWNNNSAELAIIPIGELTGN